MLTASMDNQHVPQSPPQPTPRSKEEIDYTAQRDERCFKIAQEVTELLIKHNVVLQDIPYIKQKMLEHLQNFYFQLTIDHFDEMWNFIEISVSEHIKNANKVLWGKDANDIKVKDVESVLKKGQEQEKKKES